MTFLIRSVSCSSDKLTRSKARLRENDLPMFSGGESLTMRRQLEDGQGLEKGLACKLSDIERQFAQIDNSKNII